MEKNISQDFSAREEKFHEKRKNSPRSFGCQTRYLLTFNTVFSLLLITILISVPANAERIVTNLSDYDWGLFRDFDAEWTDDDIYPPPVEIEILPVNPPTCGWDNLNNHFEKTVHLPATVEEYFWGDNRNNEGDGGDYRGVSWWVTTVTVPSELKGKRVFLDFESVHYRAEVFINRKLVGYDTVSCTPFEVDVTDAVNYGNRNEIAVRITDPGGKFTYDTLTGIRWGKHLLPPNHGFGGITGGVSLRAVDSVYIDDIWVKNKPSITEVDVVVLTKNLTGTPSRCTFQVKVYPWKNPDEVIFENFFKRSIELSETETVFTVKARRAKLWDLDNPNLYVAEVTCVSDGNKTEDTLTQRFGFRWFDIGEDKGNQRFYLNGKRVVLKSVYTWGFWPVNGIYPTREMSERNTEQIKAFGIDMIAVHTSIVHQTLMDAADENGIFIRETSGGYYRRSYEQKTILRDTLRREKLFRTVKRDRSRPSLIIYNIGWGPPPKPEADDIQNIKRAHELDPTRIIVNRRETSLVEKGHPARMFMKPNDQTEHYYGWFSQYNAVNSHGYTDAYYNNPSDYHIYTDKTDEIVYRFHQSPIGAPPRLQLIKEYYDKKGKPFGWQGQYFIDWYYALDDFLDRSGFRAFFPDVDALTVSLSNVPIYHWGRVIENIRMGNVTDYYEIMGWSSAQTFNHSGLADLYRNPKGDPKILARYTHPLYIAVKLRDKVVPAGSSVTADFFIVNEKNVKGNHTLSVTLEHENAKMGFEKSFPVTINGGEEYGQLLAENVDIPLGKEEGYFTISAELRDRKGALQAEGSDKAYSIDISPGKLSANGAVVDTSGVINRTLEKIWGFTLPEFTNETPDLDYIILGQGNYNNSAVMERIANGAIAVVINRADMFAERNIGLRTHPLDYRGRYDLGSLTMGGNYIAGKHELLEGLPQAQAFNWEYQILYTPADEYRLYALRLYGAQPIVAAVADHKKEVFTAVSVIPYMRGRIILSTLNIIPHLDSDAPQSIAAKRLFGNYLKYASKYSGKK